MKSFFLGLIVLASASVSSAALELKLNKVRFISPDVASAYIILGGWEDNGISLRFKELPLRTFMIPLDVLKQGSIDPITLAKMLRSKLHHEFTIAHSPSHIDAVSVVSSILISPAE